MGSPRTGAGKIIAKMMALAKENAGDIKEMAKEEGKKKAREIYEEIKAKLPTEEEIKDFFVFSVIVKG